MFKYYNNNPLGIEEEDCVTRAISLASNRPYAEISDKLYYTAALLDCDKLCVCCYYHLLDYVFQYPRINCVGMTVSEFAKKHPKGTYLIRMEGHITCLKNGVIYDLWDCGKRKATHVWKTE